MPYDPNLDQEKWGEEVELDGNKVKVSIMSYNDGTPKLQLSRQRQNADGEWSFAKLGRMTKEEAEKVLPLFDEAVKRM